MALQVGKCGARKVLSCRLPRCVVGAVACCMAWPLGTRGCISSEITNKKRENHRFGIIFPVIVYYIHAFMQDAPRCFYDNISCHYTLYICVMQSAHWGVYGLFHAVTHSVHTSCRVPPYCFMIIFPVIVYCALWPTMRGWMMCHEIINILWFCDSACFALRFGLFRAAKWPVLCCEMACFATLCVPMRYAVIANETLSRWLSGRNTCW